MIILKSLFWRIGNRKLVFQFSTWNQVLGKEREKLDKLNQLLYGPTYRVVKQRLVKPD